MTLAPELEPEIGICEDVIFPPGDLLSDEPPLETELHLRQIILFLQCLEWLWRDRNDFYAAGNLTIYQAIRAEKAPKFYLWGLGTGEFIRRDILYCDMITLVSLT